MLKELFQQVLGQYRDLYISKSRNAYIEKVLLYDLKNTLTHLAAVSSEYKVYGTIGAGGLPEVPWLAICDLEITDTTREGYYLVYLFDAEMKGIFLSLALGYTQFEKMCENEGWPNHKKVAREKLQKQAHSIYESLQSIPKDFVGGSIDLHATLPLGRGYEVGQIFSKFYPVNELSSDQELLKDFQFALSAYRELKKKIGKSYVEPLNAETAIPRAKVVQEIPDNIPITELDLDIVPPAKSKKYDPKGVSHFDEEADQRKQADWKEIGERAERIVEKAEKERLIKIGKPTLAKDVKIVSENNALGYDILSFEEDGTQKHIEVKGSRNSHFQFHLTLNELDASSSPSNNYYFYHVHNVFGKPKIGFVKHPNFDSPMFRKQAAKYVVTYCPKK